MGKESTKSQRQYLIKYYDRVSLPHDVIGYG